MLKIIITIIFMSFSTGEAGHFSGDNPIANVSLEKVSVSEIEASLNVVVTDQDIHYTYRLVNGTKQNKSFLFTSAKRTEYRIKDNSGKEVLSSLTDDRGYAQTISTMVLIPGSEWKVVESLPLLTKGTYVIEVWLAVSEGEKFKQIETFEVK